MNIITKYQQQKSYFRYFARNKKFKNSERCNMYKNLLPLRLMQKIRYFLVNCIKLVTTLKANEEEENDIQIKKVFL